MHISFLASAFNPDSVCPHQHLSRTLHSQGPWWSWLTSLLSPFHVASHHCFSFVFQDLLMVTYLANLTQSQIALNEKLVNL